jgi:hypothetical protein
MFRALPLAIALTLVIAAGLVHGRWTQRWSPSRAVEDAVVRLEGVPMILGDWQGRPLQLDREELAVAGIAGSVARRYENHRVNAAVSVLLVCGRPGSISVHTPDICYAGAGFEPIRPVGVLSLPLKPSGPPETFRDAVLGKTTMAVPTYLRILWSWSAAGAWETPDNPRLAFAPRQVLYKLYVIREMATSDERIDDDPSTEFLRILLPALERSLFGHESGGAARLAHRSLHQVGVLPQCEERSS